MEQERRWLHRIAKRHPEFTPEKAADFFNAWKHTGQIRVHEGQNAVCELCGYPRLRYQFLVAHRVTGEVIWVGSECVLNFEQPDLAVSACQRQARRERASAARAEQDQHRFSAMLAQLHPIYQQASRTEQRRIRWMVGKARQCGGFSPGDLGWLYLASLASGIPLEIELFPMTLKSRQDRQELGNLSLGGLRWIAPGLTETQRETCERLGVRLDVEC